MFTYSCPGRYLFRAIAALSLVVSVPFAGATELQLPAANTLSTDPANSFQLVSLDLLRQCAGALDPRCLPGGPFSVASSLGQIADQAIVLTSANGMSNTPSPFAVGAPVDNVFLTPTGNQSSTYGMDAQTGGKFAGDLAQR